jgi:hypothetical protein
MELQEFNQARKALHHERLKQSHIEKIKETMIEYGITTDDLAKEIQTDKEKLYALRKVSDHKEKHRRAIKAATEQRRINRLKATMTEEKTKLLSSKEAEVSA